MRDPPLYPLLGILFLYWRRCRLRMGPSKFIVELFIFTARRKKKKKEDDVDPLSQYTSPSPSAPQQRGRSRKARQRPENVSRSPAPTTKASADAPHRTKSSVLQSIQHAQCAGVPSGSAACAPLTRCRPQATPPRTLPRTSLHHIVLSLICLCVALPCAVQKATGPATLEDDDDDDDEAGTFCVCQTFPQLGKLSQLHEAAGAVLSAGSGSLSSP